MSKKQRISPVQLNLMMTQRLILAELLKISDLLGKKPLLNDYSPEVQKRISGEIGKAIQKKPSKESGADRLRKAN